MVYKLSKLEGELISTTLLLTCGPGHVGAFTKIPEIESSEIWNVQSSSFPLFIVAESVADIPEFNPDAVRLNEPADPVAEAVPAPFPSMLS